MAMPSMVTYRWRWCVSSCPNETNRRDYASPHAGRFARHVRQEAKAFVILAVTKNGRRRRLRFSMTDARIVSMLQTSAVGEN